jgi:hypothetical protein
MLSATRAEHGDGREGNHQDYGTQFRYSHIRFSLPASSIDLFLIETLQIFLLPSEG